MRSTGSKNPSVHRFTAGTHASTSRRARKRQGLVPRPFMPRVRTAHVAVRSRGKHHPPWGERPTASSDVGAVAQSIEVVRSTHKKTEYARSTKPGVQGVLPGHSKDFREKAVGVEATRPPAAFSIRRRSPARAARDVERGGGPPLRAATPVAPRASRRAVPDRIGIRNAPAVSAGDVRGRRMPHTGHCPLPQRGVASCS